MASFAGIHRSVLGVCGLEAVLGAIKACYASLWTPQALAYRRRLGLTDEAVACSVLLCAMVESTAGGPPFAAGVAFSCDPRTGRRDLVTISASHGLGEAVVGGRVNPEEIAVSVADYRQQVVGRHGESGRILTDDQVLALTRLVLRVHWALGDGQDPQDVEWAFDGERFWLVQARAVTNLPRMTFPAVAHLPVVWSNANLKDAQPDVQTTITRAVYQEQLRAMLYSPIAATGYSMPSGMEVIRHFGGRGYFDLTSFFWAWYDALGMTPHQVNHALGGAQPEIPVPPGNPLSGRVGLHRWWRWLRLLRALWRHIRTYPAQVESVRAEASRLRAVDLEGLADDALLALVQHVAHLAIAFGAQFMLASQSVWDNALAGILERARPGRGQALAAALMAGSGGVVTAEYGYRLFDLAATASRDAAARAYFESEPLDPTAWHCLPTDSAFRRAMGAFLDEHGHRGLYEMEVANPRWCEDQTYLLEQIRHFLSHGQTEPPRDMARTRRRAAEVEVSPLHLPLRALVHWLAGQAQNTGSRREVGKSALVALIDPLRRIALEAGRRMVTTGALTCSNDVFHLSLVDLESYLRGEWSGIGARELVTDRKAQYEAWSATVPPDILILDAEGQPATLLSLPSSTSGVVSQAVPQLSRDGVTILAGVGVAAGQASGPARVIRHPDEGRRLQPGDILVAPSTDPGWTPLFLRVGGVVMEVGGYLSHGAIVAREYGLPAVATIPGLLETVTDGQILTVDGDTGRVILTPLSYPA
jgi:pyruvate,water dikinase